MRDFTNHTEGSLADLVREQDSTIEILEAKLEIAVKALEEIKETSLSAHGKSTDIMIFKCGVFGGLADAALTRIQVGDEK